VNSDAQLIVDRLPDAVDLDLQGCAMLRVILDSNLVGPVCQLGGDQVKQVVHGRVTGKEAWIDWLAGTHLRPRGDLALDHGEHRAGECAGVAAVAAAGEFKLVAIPKGVPFPALPGGGKAILVGGRGQSASAQAGKDQ
jgi:hypothetical protein